MSKEELRKSFDDMLTLPLEVAEGAMYAANDLLEITDKVNDPNKLDSTDKKHRQMFIDMIAYLKLCVDAELEFVKIPERHISCYAALIDKITPGSGTLLIMQYQLLVAI